MQNQNLNLKEYNQDASQSQQQPQLNSQAALNNQQQDQNNAYHNNSAQNTQRENTSLEDNMYSQFNNNVQDNPLFSNVQQNTQNLNQQVLLLLQQQLHFSNQIRQESKDSTLKTQLAIENTQQALRELQVKMSSQENRSTNTKALEVEDQFRQDGVEPIENQPRISVPQIEIDHFKGKSYLIEFLQYLQRTKLLLQSSNISLTQQKVLLNNHLPVYMQDVFYQACFDHTIHLDKFVKEISDMYGPKGEQIIQQINKLQFLKYDNYFAFSSKIKQLSVFADLSEPQALYIINQKFPNFISCKTKSCQTFQDFFEQLKQLMQEGWFQSIDEAFRASLSTQVDSKDFDNNGKQTLGKGKYYGKKYNNSFGNTQNTQQNIETQQTQSQNTQEGVVSNAVANIIVKEPLQLNKDRQHLLTFANQSQDAVETHPHNTRFQKKRQHLEQPQNFSENTQNSSNISNTQSFQTQPQSAQLQNFQNLGRQQVQDFQNQSKVQTFQNQNTRPQPIFPLQSEPTFSQFQQQSAEQPLNFQTTAKLRSNFPQSQGTLKQHFGTSQAFQDKTQGQNMPQQHLLQNEKLQKIIDQLGIDNQTQKTSTAAPKAPKAKANQDLTQSTTSQTPSYTVLDPMRYIDPITGQLNMTKAFKETCMAAPIDFLLQVTGYEVVPKQNTGVLRNSVYASQTTQPTSSNLSQLQHIETDQYNTSTNQNFLDTQNIYTSHALSDQNIQIRTPYFDSLGQQPKQEYEYQTSEFDRVIKQDNVQDEFSDLVKQINQVRAQRIQEQDQIQNISNKINLENVQNSVYKSLVSNNKHICISMFINNIQIIGVIDSGAQQSVMSLQQANKLHISNQIIHLKDKDQIYVQGVTGDEKVLGYLNRPIAILEGHEILLPHIFIQQNAGFDFIIGLDILRLFKFQLDMHTSTLTFVPTLDDPRVTCKTYEICEPNQNSSIIKTQVSAAYIKWDPHKNFDIINYLYNVYTLYPKFPMYKKYQIIYVDPPWKYQAPMHNSSPPYNCLSFQELKLLPINAIADQLGCILLIWSTSTHINQCEKLIEHWGFTHKNVFQVWKKIKINGEPRIGMGKYTRNLFEFLFMATMGKVYHLRRTQGKNTTISQDLNQSIQSESQLDIEQIEIEQQNFRKYCSKPLETYSQIDKVFYTEKTNNLEIFATQRNNQNARYDIYGNALNPYYQKQTMFDPVNLNYETYCNGSNQVEVSNEFYIKQGFQKSIYTQKIQQYSQSILDYIQNLNVGQNISNTSKKRLQNLILQYEIVFKFDNQLSYTNLGEVDIQIKPNCKPVRMKPYKVVGEAYHFLKAKFKELENCGLITKGASDWGTAVMCVPKDSPTEKFRAVQNFKKVNQLTIKDKYPLRIIDYILLKLRNKKYLCIVDMKGGFNQIKRSDRSKHIMAMILPFGQYIPNVMFFGETNAPSVFQRYVDLAIGDLYDEGVECYIDDIIVYGDTEEQVLKLLDNLFQRLRKFNFKLHPEKCFFFVQSGNILGHEVSGCTISPKKKKLNKLVKAEPPKNRKQLQQFMGSINYYRKFIPNLALLFKPLQHLASENITYNWDSTAQQSFQVIQSFLKNDMRLVLPDLSKQFIVFVAVTNVTYLSALTQCDVEGEYVVTYNSKVCNQSQVRMNSYLREIDCLVWALQEWRPYLMHQEFKVQCNCKALSLLKDTATSIQLLNYQLQLQDLIFEIEQVSESKLKNLLLKQFKQDSDEVQQIEKYMQELQQSHQIQQINSPKTKSESSSFKDFDLILQFDGASQQTQFKIQLGSGAFILYNNQSEILGKQAFRFKGSQTNNVAEYQALIAGLNYLINQGLQSKHILIQGDSQLVIRQLNYLYMCNSENLQPLCNQAREMLKQFKSFKIEHIDRNLNQVCDSMAKDQIKQQISEIQDQYAQKYKSNQSVTITTCQVKQLYKRLDESLISQTFVNDQIKSIPRFNDTLNPLLYIQKLEKFIHQIIINTCFHEEDCMQFIGQTLEEPFSNYFYDNFPEPFGSFQNFVKAFIQYYLDDFNSNDVTYQYYLKCLGVQNFYQKDIQIINCLSANLDYEIDRIKCTICHSEEGEESLLLCDHCNLGYHAECLNLNSIPDQDWYCDNCTIDIQEALNTNTPIDPVEDWELISFLKGELDLSSKSQKTQDRLLTRSKVYTYVDNKLFRDCEGTFKEVPTVGERMNLIEQIHQLIGHLGRDRTVSLIKTTYYWPQMRKQIEDTIRQCMLCQSQNTKYCNMPNTFPIKKAILPLQAWYFDLIELPQTSSGYNMAIIAVCGTSKWVEGKAIRSNNSLDTSTFLFDEIICRYGSPLIIRCDNGPEFQGNFRDTCERLNILIYYSSPYYPQSNGQVERMNRTIKDGLVKLSNSMSEYQYDWDQLLAQIFFGIRITISRATKFTPFQLVFGQDPHIPGFIGVNQIVQTYFPNEEEQYEYIIDKLRFKQSIQPMLQQNLRDMEDEIDNVINSRETISPSNLELGMLVFIKREKRVYPQTRSKGPFIFLGYGNDNKTTAIIVNPKNLKIKQVNITKINPIKLY